MADGVAVNPGLSEEHREAAAAIYWEAFEAKLGLALGPAAKARAFLASTLDPAFAIAATKGPSLLGVAGFKTADGACLGMETAALRRIYGLSALWRGAVLALLARPAEPGILTMDGIAAAAGARGRGVGTRLLAAISAEAAARGCHAVRLDVIETNPRARALYLREGFVPVRTVRLGPLRPLFGFGMAETMRRAISPEGAA